MFRSGNTLADQIIARTSIIVKRLNLKNLENYKQYTPIHTQSCRMAT